MTKLERRFTTVEAQVAYGLDQVSEGRQVTVSLRDLLYVHQTISELVRFFHQPLHWETLDEVQRFIGDRDNGALHVIWESYYDRLAKMLPKDIEEAFGEGAFDHPDSPYYYE